MSEQGSSGEASGGALADAVAARARQRHARDKGLVEAARAGDRTAFGKLYDEWVDSVYDRAVHAGASAAEAREITEQTFLTVWRDLGKLKQPAAFGAKVLQVARRETLARVAGGEKLTPKSGPSAEDRLTRATSAADTAADPEAAAVLREAAHALDEQTRDVLDLHFRLGLTRNEVAAVLGEQPDKVAQTITKLPPALAVLTRARILWRGGSPEDEGLRDALAADGVTSFNASAVRIINRYAKENDRARARSLMGIQPVELFAAIPLADAPAGLKTAVASLLVSEAVPMDGSAFVKRDDKGEIVDAPKATPADGSVRPGIENKRPNIDPEKAAAVAAAALAAERAADDETAAAAAADAAGKGRRERKGDKSGKGRDDAAPAATEPASDDAPPPDLAARKGDGDRGSGTGAKVAGAAAAGAALGAAGAAGAASASSGGTSGSGASTPTVSPASAGRTTFPAEDADDDVADETAGAGEDAGTPGSAAGGSGGTAKSAAAAGAGAAAGVGASKAAGASGAGDGSATVVDQPARGAGGGGRAGEDQMGDGGGPGKWIAIGVAAVVLIALIAFVATRGGDTQEVATGGNPPTTVATTSTSKAPGTTKATTSTTFATTTTAAPTDTTEAPTDTTAAPGPTTPPTTRGGGPTPPPTTEAPPPTVPPVSTTFSISPTGPVLNGYDPNAPGSPKLSWSVQGDAPVTVTVEGPGFASSLQNATNQGVCPVNLKDGRCTIDGFQDQILDFTYRMTVKQAGYPDQIKTVVLYIQIPRADA